MKITRENIDELNGIIRMSIEKEDYELTVADGLKEQRRKAKIPGFRPGNVPAGLIKKMFGKAILLEEINKLMSKDLTKFIFDEKLDILGEPLPNNELQKEINWDNDTEFEFVFDVAFAPQFEIEFDAKKKYPFYQIIVTDEMIDEQINAYCNRFGENAPAETIIEKETVKGNFVQVNENGEEIENGIASEMSLISIDIIKDDAILSNFIGKKVDDTIIFDIKKAYPNNTEVAYILNISKPEAEELSGDFKFTIKEIHTFVPATVDQELYTKIYGEATEITTNEAFRAEVKTEIEKGFEMSAIYRFGVDAHKLLVENISFDLPKEFLKRWIIATNRELTLEQIEKDFDNFMLDLKWQIIKEKISKKYEIKVTEDDVLALAKEVAAAQFRQYGMYNVLPEHLDGFAKQMLQKEDERTRLYSKKSEDKVFEAVKANVKIDIKKVSKEEFESLFK